jgi:hypothetical protein
MIQQDPEELMELGLGWVVTRVRADRPPRLGRQCRQQSYAVVIIYVNPLKEPRQPGRSAMECRF